MQGGRVVQLVYLGSHIQSTTEDFKHTWVQNWLQNSRTWSGDG